MWPERRPGRGSGALPAKALGRARIDDLRAVVGQRHAHVGQRRDGADIHLGMECLRRPFARRRSRAAGLRPSISAGRRRGCKRSWRRRCETSTTPAAPNKGRGCRRRRWCRRRRCRARRRLRRIVSGPAACAAARSNDRAIASMSKNTAPGMWPCAIFGMRVALLRRRGDTRRRPRRRRGRANARRAIRSTRASGSAAMGQGRFGSQHVCSRIQWINAGAAGEVHS